MRIEEILFGVSAFGGAGEGWIIYKMTDSYIYSIFGGFGMFIIFMIMSSLVICMVSSTS